MRCSPGATTAALFFTGRWHDSGQILDEQNVDPEERYMFYSPRGMRKLLTDTQVTNADYNTIKALAEGGFPVDHQWLGCYWRRSTKLPKTGNIRSSVMFQKMAVGLSIGLIREIEVSTAPQKWNNTQAIIKLAAGAVRVDDLAVVQIDYDESV